MIRPATPRTPGAVLNTAHWQARGLWRWFPLQAEAGTGRRPRDFSIYRQPGAMENMAADPWAGSGDGGFALRADGSDDSVNCGTAAVPAGSGVTVCCWVRPRSGGDDWGRFTAKAIGSGSSLHDFMLSHTGTADSCRLRFTNGAGTAVTVTDSSDLNSSGWNFVAGTWDYSDDSVVLSIDAVSVGTGSLSGTIRQSAYTMRVGANGPDTEHFSGDIQDVRVYTRPLALDELREIMRDPWAALMSPAPQIFYVPAGGTTHEVGLSIAAQSGVAPGVSAIFNAGVTVGAQSSVSDGAQANMQGATTIGSLSSLAASAQAVFGGAVSVGAQSGITAAVMATMSGDVTVGGQSTISVDGAANIQAAITLAITSAIATDADSAIPVALTMAAQSGISSDVQANMNVALSIDALAAIIPGVQGNFEVAVGLAAASAYQIMAGAVVDAGLSIGAISGITTNGTVLTFSVSTPDARTFRVGFDLRTMRVEKDVRKFDA